MRSNTSLCLATAHRLIYMNICYNYIIIYPELFECLKII